MSDERKDYQLTVVIAVKENGKRVHKDFHLAVKNCREQTIEELRRTIARVGFRSDGVRYFPDQIESLTYQEVEIGDA